MADRILWTQRQDIGPSARSQHAMTYVASQKRTLLFGGTTFPFNTANNLGDTWEWDGDFWVQIAQFGPPASTAHVLAYDAKRDRVVLFRAGRDTWEWDGTNWTQVADTGPAGGSFAGMVYDASLERMVLFGGFGATGPLGETWQWDGVEWTQESNSGPSGRMNAAMAFDSIRNRVVLFGGWTTTLFGDTWEWDGSSWEQMADFGPSSRMGHAMAFDPNRGRVVLFGGGDKQSQPGVVTSGCNDTWEWDGKRWFQRQDMGPAPRLYHSMTYDENRHRMVVFGGLLNVQPTPSDLGDTWELFDPGGNGGNN